MRTIAIDLVARFRAQDNLSNRLRKITSTFEKTQKATDSYRDSVGRLRNANGRFAQEQRGLLSGLRQSSGGMRSFSGAVTGASRAVSNQVNSLGGLRSSLLGVVGAYASARGAASLFDNTIGAAARFEASEVAVEAIFNDKKLSDSYMEMVDKMAIDSPLLNSTDMLASSKGIVAMTKDLDELRGTWSIIEKLQVLDPTQGTDGAAFAMKEMFQGDSLSMVERFGLNKSELNRIKKLSIPQQIAEINSLLNGMGVTEAAINKMGQTTLGYWAQIGERAERFKRMIGESSNSKLGEVLGSIVDKLDSIDLDAIAAKVDAGLAGAVQKVLNFSKKAWEMRDPILATAKAVGAFIGVFAGIVVIAKTIGGIGAAIAFLASPIGLAAGAIIGIGLAFKAAYKHSEPFRKVVDGVVGGVKGLYKLLTGNGVGAIGTMLDAGLDMSQVGKVTAFVSVVKSRVSDFVSALKAKWTELQPAIAMLIERFVGMKDLAVSIFTSLWGFLQPIFSRLGNSFMVIADIASMVWRNIVGPAIGFVTDIFQTLWIVVGPILKLLGEAFGVAFDVLKIVWDTILKPLADFLLGGFKTAFEEAKVYTDKIADAFGTFAEKVGKAVDWVGKIKDAVANFKVPDWLSRLGGGGTVKFEASSPDGKHFHGIGRIPYDNYAALLHRGERVLTRQEADAMDHITYEAASAGITTYDNRTYNNVNTTNSQSQAGSGSGGGIHIAKFADEIIIREEADMDAWVAKLIAAKEAGGK